MTWNGWSVHAFLLPYLEATPVYNAINFSFDPLVCASQPFQNTAFLTQIPGFLCPTDPYSGKSQSLGFLNNYCGSIGTTIGVVQTTRVNRLESFRISRPTASRTSPTARRIRSPSASRWSAMGARTANYRGNGVAGLCYAWILDATQNVPQTMATIQMCNSGWNSAIQSGSPYNGTINIGVNRGWYWGWGAESMTLINTIVPPSSQQYPWNACRTGCQGCGNYDMDHAEIANVTSQHPGGANVLFRRWPCPVHQELTLYPHLVGARHAKRRRSDQLGFLLMIGQPDTGLARSACQAGGARTDGLLVVQRRLGRCSERSCRFWLRCPTADGLRKTRRVCPSGDARNVEMTCLGDAPA